MLVSVTAKGKRCKTANWRLVWSVELLIHDTSYLDSYSGLNLFLLFIQGKYSLLMLPINALLHINTAPYWTPPPGSLPVQPASSTAGCCKVAGANDGYPPCSRAKGISLVNNYAHADFPLLLLHFLKCDESRPLHAALTSRRPRSSCSSWWKPVFARSLRSVFAEWGRRVLLVRLATTVN